MKMLVYGGRDYRNKKRLYEELSAIHRETPVTLVIEGGAPGADRYARYWAQKNDIPVETYRADWDNLQVENVRARQRPDGSYFNAAAGAQRNYLMMAKGQPDIAVEFPGGNGTAQMRWLVRREIKKRPLRYVVVKE